MIENFDYNHIKNDSNLFFGHLKKICQITHFDLIEDLFVP